MTLAFLVYLISVIPTLGFLFTVFAVITCVIFALFLLSSCIGLDVWRGHGEEHTEVIKARSTLKLLRTKFWIPLVLVLVATLIPDKTTIYTMIAAYAGQKIAETPQAQQIGNDAVDVLHELLAKAKRELKEDAKEETKK